MGTFKSTQVVNAFKLSNNLPMEAGSTPIQLIKSTKKYPDGTSKMFWKAVVPSTGEELTGAVSSKITRNVAEFKKLLEEKPALCCISIVEYEDTDGAVKEVKMLHTRGEQAVELEF